MIRLRHSSPHLNRFNGKWNSLKLSQGKSWILRRTLSNLKSQTVVQTPLNLKTQINSWRTKRLLLKKRWIVLGTLMTKKIWMILQNKLLRDRVLFLMQQSKTIWSKSKRLKPLQLLTKLLYYLLKNKIICIKIRMMEANIRQNLLSSHYARPIKIILMILWNHLLLLSAM